MVYNSPMHTFPSKLKEFRVNQGLTQEAVAEQVGLASTEQLSKWEEGTLLPNIESLFKLASVLNTYPHELYPAFWHGKKIENESVQTEQERRKKHYHLFMKYGGGRKGF